MFYFNIEDVFKDIFNPKPKVKPKSFTDLKPRKGLTTVQKMITWRFMENLRQAIIHDKLNNPTK